MPTSRTTHDPVTPTRPLADGPDPAVGGDRVPEPGALLTRGEVAALFGVDPRTVSTWARQGRLPAIRTVGGHRRFRAEHVHALYRQLAGAPLGRSGPTG